MFKLGSEVGKTACRASFLAGGVMLELIIYASVRKKNLTPRGLSVNFGKLQKSIQKKTPTPSFGQVPPGAASHGGDGAEGIGVAGTVYQMP